MISISEILKQSAHLEYTSIETSEWDIQLPMHNTMHFLHPQALSDSIMSYYYHERSPIMEQSYENFCRSYGHQKERLLQSLFIYCTSNFFITTQSSRSQIVFIIDKNTRVLFTLINGKITEFRSPWGNISIQEFSEPPEFLNHSFTAQTIDWIVPDFFSIDIGPKPKTSKRKKIKVIEGIYV